VGCVGGARGRQGVCMGRDEPKHGRHIKPSLEASNNITGVTLAEIR
jgi:hypothetical protein